jgi:sulfatase modifying factor 1
MGVSALLIACGGCARDRAESGDAGAGSAGTAGAFAADGQDAADGGQGDANTGGSAGTNGNSCSGMNGTECPDADCCASLPVTGGTFEQGSPGAFSSTVSSFLLDKYEVTVGRFRNFVAVYDAWHGAGNPVQDSGANASVPGSGWSASFDSSLPASAAVIISEIATQCSDTIYPTWSDSGNDALPINCTDWYMSFAFCIWEGKRLPTESEWEYAASSGSNDTLYSWGNVPVPDDSLDTANLAVYGCLGDGVPGCSFADILPVGSRPDGNGLFGQSDLAGSMWEWGLDWFAPYPTSAQTNYANIATGSTRVIRGGDYGSPASTLPAAFRYSYGFPNARFTNVGFRCARNQ